MAVENLSGSLFMDGIDNSDPSEKAKGKFSGARVRSIVEKVEVTAGASATSTYRLGKIPSNAVILPQSTIHWDDLDAAGAPTLDVGLEGDNITNDDNALADGLDVTSAGSSDLYGGDIANVGQEAWEFVSGETEDPQEVLDVVATLKDAAASVGGTVLVEIYYAER
jgi:hypothetical protein